MKTLRSIELDPIAVLDKTWGTRSSDFIAVDKRGSRCNFNGVNRWCSVIKQLVTIRVMSIH